MASKRLAICLGLVIACAVAHLLDGCLDVTPTKPFGCEAGDCGGGSSTPPASGGSNPGGSSAGGSNPGGGGGGG